MSENERNDRSVGENEALRQIVAEQKRFNDRFGPVPWYKLKLGQPLAAKKENLAGLGFTLIVRLFLVKGFIKADAGALLASANLTTKLGKLAINPPPS